jgi:hypothetical protein
MFALFLPAALAAPLQPEPMSDETYAETYTAVAALEDGSFVLLQLLFTNAGLGSGKGGCRALWVPPGQDGINTSHNGDRSDWSYDAGAATLTVGDCSLGPSEDGLRFVATLPELSVEMTLTGAAARSVSVPDGRISVKSSTYESDLIVPWARASVSLRAGGQDKTLSGHAHLDHSRSNTLLPEVAQCWMRFRGFSGASPILLQVRMPPEGAPVGWAWPLAEAAPRAVDAANLTAFIGADGQPRLTVDGTTVSPDRPLYRYRPTEAYGALGRLAAPWIGDPTTTTYRATASVDGGTVRGILEVSQIVADGCSAP